MLRVNRWSVRAVLVVVVVLACTGMAIAAPAGNELTEQIPDEPVVSKVDGSSPPRVALSPARFEDQRADPGTTLRLAISVTNFQDEPVTLQSTVLPLQGSTDPDSFATTGDDESVSAAAVEWVEMPFEIWPSLAPDRQLRFPVTIRIPESAAPGSYALGLGVRQRVSGPSIGGLDTNDARVRLDAGVVSQIVVTVTGDAAPDLRVRDVEAPRLIWGGSSSTFSASAFNEGNTLLEVDAEVRLDAFIGTAARDLSTEAQPLLPGGRRDIELRWSDPPLVGWFRPKLVVVGGEGSGERVEKSLDTVYVLPPWWLVLLAAIAIWLPVRSVRKRRRRMQATGADRAKAIERVEARRRKAEAKRRAEAARRRGRR